MNRRPRQLLIVTASMGAGHNAVAAELARRARECGCSAQVLDLIAAAGRSGARLQATYRGLLRHGPWIYTAAMSLWRRWPAPLERYTAWRAGPFEHAILDAAAACSPDVVVSTYPLGSQAIGRLVACRALRVPAVTVVVDPGAHPYWIAPVDLTLAPTELTAAELRGFGARDVVVTDVVTAPEFRHPPGRDEARRATGLPRRGTVVLINGGSWAVGRIGGAVDVVTSVPGVRAVVLCAHDRDLRTRMASRPGVDAVGWTDRMVDLLAAADVLLDNAGGQTCREALACGTPVLLYRPLPGHGRLNAATLDRLGLARWVRDGRTLREVVRSGDFATRPAAGVPTAARDPLAAILDMAGARA